MSEEENNHSEESDIDQNIIDEEATNEVEPDEDEGGQTIEQRYQKLTQLEHVLKR
jgi:hypothetical protein